MGNKRIERAECGYTQSLDALVVALCLDYSRRECAIRTERVTPRTGMEYKYLNYRIYEGAAEIAGERYADVYINEIGRKIGYASTRHDAVSERTYKEQKQEVKINIARKLHLLD